MIVNINFDKINVERKKEAIGEINIKKNIRIKDVEEKELFSVAGKQKALSFKFEFSITYEPGIASLEIIGNILYINDNDKLKEIMNKWKKEQKIDQALSAILMNRILTKCDIKALVLSQDLNLPPTVPLPIIARKESLKKAK